MFSIIIPSLNNMSYLKLCISSLKKNSHFNHEIIVHVNVGSDGTIDYLKSQNIRFTHSSSNVGICKGVNTAAAISSKEYILYAHDDFYFCPRWDLTLSKEIEKIGNNLFYLSGTMIEIDGKFPLDCGNNIINFNEDKLLANFQKIHSFDFQGSTWAPHLIHKDIWNKVGGFSEEYFPGTGSDPDLNMKLWNIGVRIFKGLKDSKVYHFGSTVTRKHNDKSQKTESGSKGAKIFLQKWGISIKFFKKYYLKSDTIYEKPLSNPTKSIKYFFGLIKCKILYLFYKIIF